MTPTQTPALTWPEFTIATWNPGDRGWRETLALILATFGLPAVGPAKARAKVTRDRAAKLRRVMADESIDVLVLQEMGDQDDALDELEAAGYGVTRGDAAHPGSSKLAHVYRPDTMHPRRVFAPVKLSDRANVGAKGAGPSILAPKYVLAIEYRHQPSGRTPVVGTWHQIPSIHLPRRKPLARRIIRRVAAWSRNVSEYGGLTFLAGDLNAQPDHETIQTLREAGLVSTHELLGAVRTFRARTIDYVMHDGGDVELIEHHAVFMGNVGAKRNRRDHDLLVATYRLRPLAEIREEAAARARRRRRKPR